MSGTPAPAAPPEALPAEQFPPTLREVMLRPAWIGMLLACLAVAAVFAWLGQWQFERAIDRDPPPPGATEQVLPIEQVAVPGEYLTETSVGQRVEVSGEWVPGDFLVVGSRFDDGERGYWVTGQLRVSGAERLTSLAVALGWTANRADADAAAAAYDAWVRAGDAGTQQLTGRLISDEGPGNPNKRAEDPFEMTRMSPAVLLSRWHDIDIDVAGGGIIDVYRVYLTTAEVPGQSDASTDAGAALRGIHSPAPTLASPINWLNIFYAVEWVIFAGFAFYLWYRLARDAWERELEDLEEGDAAAA